jgi:hypothetical protein
LVGVPIRTDLRHSEARASLKVSRFATCEAVEAGKSAQLGFYDNNAGAVDHGLRDADPSSRVVADKHGLG